MTFLTASKGPATGLLLTIAYGCFIMAIVMITQSKDLYDGLYPPAVVPLLVTSCLQMIYLTVYFAKGKSWGAFSGAAMMGANLFFTLFTFGSIVAVTVLYKQGNSKYCPHREGVPMSDVHNCEGDMRGTMGMGWSLFGMNLIWMGIAAGVVSSTRSSWSTPFGAVPLPQYDAEADKAPVH